MLLFECTLRNGQVERWSTHNVSAEGLMYAPRVLRHNLFEMQTAANLGVDAIPKVSFGGGFLQWRFFHKNYQAKPS